MIRAKELYEIISKEWETKKSEIPWDAKNPVWTKWIKDYFTKLGKDRGFKVESSRLPSGNGEGEYLVDACWWKKQTNQYWLELIVESEWDSSSGEIEQDFYKLIDIKAYLKVWICSWSDNQYQKREKLLSDLVAQTRFKIPEEEYLIINLPFNKESNYKDSLLIYSFWMNNMGEPNILQTKEIRR